MCLWGAGKPENQNHALIFTRGEHVQAIDMNQEGYFEEAFKVHYPHKNTQTRVSNDCLSDLGQTHQLPSTSSSLPVLLSPAPPPPPPHPSVFIFSLPWVQMRNMLQEFAKGLQKDVPTTILGFREHIFTGSVSSLANYMALQVTTLFRCQPFSKNHWC